jgi:hypothetical protein
MSDTVVDSSVVAKWVLPKPDSAHAERLIAEVALRGHQIRKRGLNHEQPG